MYRKILSGITSMKEFSVILLFIPLAFLAFISVFLIAEHDPEKSEMIFYKKYTK